MKIQLPYRVLYTAEIYSLQFKKKNGVITAKETDRHFTKAPRLASVIIGFAIKKSFSVRSVADVQIAPDEWEFFLYNAANALSQAYTNTTRQTFANAKVFCAASSGNDKKIINGICESGIKICISFIPSPGGVYQCRYHYKFSDNTFSAEYVEQNMPSPCIPE